MKPTVVLSTAVALLFRAGLAAAQTTEEAPKLNLLAAPSAPAFVLMGIEPATIEKPTNLTDLSLVINNATKGFTALPQNFAVQFSPYWMLRDNGKRMSYQEYNSNKVADIMPQTLQFSLGVAQPEVAGAGVGSTKLGAGLKVSVLRGQLDTAVTNAIEARKRAAELENRGFDLRLRELMRTKYPSGVPNPATKPTEFAAYTQDVNRIERQIREDDVKIREARTKAMQRLSNVAFTRSGWKLDVAGGVALDFPDQRFNNSRVDKWGVWLTGGYEVPNRPWSVLGVARLLTTPSTAEAFAQTSFDAGGRLIYNKVLRQKGSLSVEYAHREVLERGRLSSNRYVFNVEYPFLPNQLLTLSLGRNFDGTTIQEGNLIAALNLVFGLGSRRNIEAP
ncbi:hypothetical protein [Hymenobacter cellulosivorans]|uniref:DUF3078 domain-containing protein n=1 Tax=Hymenobacter cellulosivorans TaxID=2932249 RepID=A0ABY4FJZ5_9BACT|nr:hypothetical protein [Hymenobacter cellulosivorans]UOQ54941.1 hypothetical protein MUN80_09330 [Hymenobacter cellulosivorans]